jgi:nucleotide-binding universal stress UspA family protein
MIKDILVHADGTKAGAQRIAYALDLARRHHAVLNGLHVTPDPDVPPTYKPSMIGIVAVEQERRLAEDAKLAERNFAAAVSKRRIRNRWTSLKGAMAAQIREAARTADIVILGQYEWEGAPERHPLSLAEAVAIDCGRPVLAIPAGFTETRIRRALVAWDGGREATRALHDAFPLLDGTRVELVVAAEKSDENSLRALSEHLHHHHIVTEGDIHICGQPAAARLMERLQQKQFDLLVMGAYGRPAWLEFLFGGVTQTALLHSTVPVLVSH